MLVEQCLAGRLEAFDELVGRHQDAVYNLLLKLSGDHTEAADLTQEAFVRAYRKLDGYDPRFSFKNWVITIGVNLAKNRFRHFARRRRIEMEAASPTPSSPSPPDPRLEALEAALGLLPEKLRLPLLLRHVEGCSYAEIAQMLGIGVSAAKMRVMRARDELVQEMNHETKHV